MAQIGFDMEYPGVVLFEEYLQPMGITKTRFSRDLGISFRRANELLNGKRDFTPDTALQVAKYIGTTPEFWMNWQVKYDLQRTEKARHSEYEKIEPFSK